MTTTEHNPTTNGTDGAALLAAIHAALTKYVVMPSEHATDAVTLWIACTHAQPAWAHAPRLVVRGPNADAANPGCSTSWKPSATTH